MGDIVKNMLRRVHRSHAARRVHVWPASPESATIGPNAPPLFDSGVRAILPPARGSPQRWVDTWQSAASAERRPSYITAVNQFAQNVTTSWRTRWSVTLISASPAQSLPKLIAEGAFAGGCFEGSEMATGESGAAGLRSLPLEDSEAARS